MAEAKPSQVKSNSVVKSAIYFASGTFVSRILGLARESLLVAVFGVTVSDAFLAAFRFPNLFRRIFGEGALSACFIPLYVEYKNRGDVKSLNQLTVGIFALLLMILIPLNVIMVAGMDYFLPWWMSGEGFSSVPGKMELTVLLTKIMFPFLLLVSLFAFLMALLNAHKQFVMSAVAPSLFNVVIIAANLYCYMTGATSGVILAVSVLVAGFVQFAILIPPVRRLNIPWKFDWQHMSSEPVRRTLRAFLPSVLGLGIIQFMALINLSFAAKLQEGAVTYVNAADRLLELPLSLVAVSLGTVLLPSLSEKLGSEEGRSLLNRELAKTLKILLFLCVPAAIGLGMIAELLVRLLYEHGAFTYDRSLIVAGIVQVYAFTLVGAALSRIMSQGFYAHKDTVNPAIGALCGLLLHLVFAPLMMERWGIYGLVTSTAVAAFVNCIYLFVVYRLRYGSFHFVELLGYAAKCAVAGVTIVAVCAAVNHWLPQSNFLEQLLATGVAVSVSGVFYFAASVVLRLEEAQTVVRRFRRRRS